MRGRKLSEGSARGKYGRAGMGNVRASHSPEFNLIQQPELVRLLAQVAGLRQSHITPALSDTVVPVIVVADASASQARENLKFASYAQGGIAGGGGALKPCFGVWNPPDSQINVRVIHWRAQIEDTAAAVNLTLTTAPQQVTDLATLAGGGALASGPGMYHDTNLDNTRCTFFWGTSTTLATVRRWTQDFQLAGTSPTIQHTLNDDHIIIPPGWAFHLSLNSTLLTSRFDNVWIAVQEQARTGVG